MVSINAGADSLEEAMARSPELREAVRKSPGLRSDVERVQEFYAVQRKSAEAANRAADRVLALAKKGQSATRGAGARELYGAYRRLGLAANRVRSEGGILSQAMTGPNAALKFTLAERATSLRVDELDLWKRADRAVGILKDARAAGKAGQLVKVGYYKNVRVPATHASIRLETARRALNQSRIRGLARSVVGTVRGRTPLAIALAAAGVATYLAVEPGESDGIGLAAVSDSTYRLLPASSAGIVEHAKPTQTAGAL